MYYTVKASSLCWANRGFSKLFKSDYSIPNYQVSSHGGNLSDDDQD